MKKLSAILLILALALTLAGCGKDDAVKAPEQEAAPEQVQQAAPTPTPLPTPTPIPVLNAASYVMQWKNDSARGFNYQIPTHWKLTASGDRYVVYEEPVPAGESGFRVAYASKKKSSTVSTDNMKKELRSMVSEMQAVYADFKWNNEISRDYMLVKFKAYSADYTYTDDNGEPMEGFLIMATYDRRIYLMNYSGPASRFDDMKPIMQKMYGYMTRIS